MHGHPPPSSYAYSQQVHRPSPKGSPPVHDIDNTHGNCTQKSTPPVSIPSQNVVVDTCAKSSPLVVILYRNHESHMDDYDDDQPSMELKAFPDTKMCDIIKCE